MEMVILTRDLVRVEQLRRKLEEYRTRRCFFYAPEIDQHSHLKRELLEELLESGSLDYEERLAAYEDYCWFDERTFRNAFGTIACYNSGDLSRVRGGTGLR